MPVAVAVHDGLDGDFLLLDLDEAQSISYIEYPTGVIYIQDQDQVWAYRLSAIGCAQQRCRSPILRCRRCTHRDLEDEFGGLR
jgi:hypothetical protein